MRIQCILCFSIFSVEDKYAGTLVECPNCHKRVAVPSAAFGCGFVIDDFVVEEPIGSGGMATVYLARQLSMDRPVALKVLAEKYSRQERFAKRFLREAKSAARLNHPNLVQPIKVGASSGFLFYAMEYVKGKTLAARIEADNSLELDSALNIIQQVSEALHLAWTQEHLIHRDVKPDNIMLAEDGHAKIMDLGIAVTKKEAVHVEISGTPKFMAPEQFRQLPLDCRSDIYSLGVSLYNAVVGYPPFNGANIKEIAHKHIGEEVQFPEKSVLFIPQRVKRLISKMMAKDPNARYQDYDELLQDIVFIRKRLAPDKEMVPSVHTISFSKYRVFEDQRTESASQVYRQRTEKKRQVEMARARAEAGAQEIKASSIFTPKRLGLVVVLLTLLLILGLGVFINEQFRISPFSRKVTLFLAQARESRAYPEFISRGETLLKNRPRSPSYLEQKRLLQLQQRLFEMRTYLLNQDKKALLRHMQKLETIGKKLDKKQEMLHKKQQELKRQAEELQQQLTTLTEKKQEITERANKASELEKKLQQKQKELDQRAKEQQQREKRLRQTRVQLERAEKYAQQLRIIDLCRAFRFDDAMALLEQSNSGDKMQDDWIAQKKQEIKDAESVIRLIRNNASRLTGKKLSIGNILAIKRQTIKVAEEKNGSTTVQVLALASLSSADILTLAAGFWATPSTWDEVSFHFLLCRGDFAAALHLRPESIALNQLVVACFQQYADEIAAYLRAGARKQAVARAKWLKSQYNDLPQYKQIEPQLIALFKNASPRIVSVRKTVSAPQTDTAIPAATTKTVPNSKTGSVLPPPKKTTAVVPLEKVLPPK